MFATPQGGIRARTTRGLEWVPYHHVLRKMRITRIAAERKARAWKKPNKLSLKPLQTTSSLTPTGTPA